jgi:hypothetical protein
MPGIESADIKTLTRGSLKKATVKLTANNKQQFDIIDLLYMRLGYTVLLEWGNSIYTTNGLDKEILRNTLIEDMFFNVSKGSYLDMLNPIETLREKYKGNYDALLGKISNFNWTFNPDGSYSIELTIISLGDVIESLKSNIAINKKTQDFFNKLYPKNNNEGTEDEKTLDEEETYTDDITSMLAIYKYINKDISNPKRIYINTPDKKSHPIAYKLSTEQEGSTTGKVSTTTITFQWKATITGHYTRISNIEESTNSNRKGRSNISNDSYSYEEFSPEFVVNKDDDEPYKQAFEAKEKFKEEIKEKYKKLSEQEKSTLLSSEKFGTVELLIRLIMEMESLMKQKQ